MLKFWKIEADQDIAVWWMPNEGPVSWEFKEFAMSMELELKATEEGYIRPIVHNAVLDFGYSYLYHEDEWLSFLSYTFLEFGIVCMENSVFYWGDFMWSRMLGPMISYGTNDFKYTTPYLPSPFPGQNAAAQFDFDWRQTKDPFVGPDFLELFLVGDLKWVGNSKSCINDRTPLNTDMATSTIAISDTAASCMAEQFWNSPLGQLNLNEKTLNELFNETSLQFDTTSYSKYIPLFQQKLGPKKPMRL